MRTEKNDKVVGSISPDLKEPDVTATELVEQEKNNTGVMVPSDTLEDINNLASGLDYSIERLNRAANRLEQSQSNSRLHFLGWAAVLLFSPIVFLAISYHMPAEWKLRAINVVLGTEKTWDAGNKLLNLSDTERYRVIKKAIAVGNWNQKEINKCLGNANALNAPITCKIIIKPSNL
tara:strand:+ start:452 stop:982 length:531 start_codon:yes stop_codon:yes gene_type:complete